MRIFEASISSTVIDFFEKKKNYSINALNSELKIICGITHFFSKQIEVKNLVEAIAINENILNEPERLAYGDFQTHTDLSNKVCNLLNTQGICPEVIIEPTCGKGHFILSCLHSFPTIKFIYGIEIYKPYIWETKFSILEHFLTTPNTEVPIINIFHYNIFDFDFSDIQQRHPNKQVLIIGNPPWVTSSKLSSLNSANLPIKSNFKNHNGLDAITGKGNFDIGEYISLQLIEKFCTLKGNFAFLVKNAVIKNILLEQKRKVYKISNIQQFNIDAKKEFNVSVNAALLLCSFAQKSDFSVEELDFYTQRKIRQYGWVGEKFVANTESYKKTNQIDGKFPFEWRQGVKHDASKVMEFEYIDGHFLNNKKDTVDIEPDLVYSLLKSSDLKGGLISKSRKYTIITQRKVGQETKYIKTKYPKTYNYLWRNLDYFKRRKSSIYKGKPLFSIFGIGNYSFKPYKVTIAGLYKTTTFTLVIPNKGKPVMLDDTCYLIGFDTLIDAEITQFLLNKKLTQEFMKSIAFVDAKRMITKDLLMRIELNEIIKNTNFAELNAAIKDISPQDWSNYKAYLKKKHFEKSQQLALFK